MAAERKSWSRKLLAGAVLAAACLAPGVVSAQGGKGDGEEPPAKREYVVQYVLVVLLSAMAIYCIVKPSPRKTEKSLTQGSS